ncbi:hypothetical protein ACNI3T_00625 [Christiangramia sp. ASW11-125]|uniref:hypothetical protein n=1 Tax=Christiangramia sp. ASW11-125 TaxID=3400701 RepID=UPI003AAB53A0
MIQSPSNYTIIKDKAIVKSIHGEDANPSDLNNFELNEIEKILEKAVGYDYTKDLNKQGLFKVNLNEYGRQYIPSTNRKGEKIVWINLFCDDIKPIPEDRLIIVMDGGKCYFRITVNLNKLTYFNLAFNGFA